MRQAYLLLIMMLFCITVKAQLSSPLMADSVKITGTGAGGELIIQNHTRGIKGFLYNAGKGATTFRSMAKKLNDSVYTIGNDTLRVPVSGLVSLNKRDTVTGIKTWAPVVKASADTGYGIIFKPVFTSTSNKDTFASVIINPAKITGASTNTYAAWFRDKVALTGDFSFYHTAAQLKGGQFYTNCWIRSADVPTMALHKPANASPEQLVITGTKTAPGSILNAGTGMKDSVIFISGVQDYSFIKAAPVLTQQDGATGPLRGLYMMPALTNVADFRGVQVDVNDSSGSALYGSGSGASAFGGQLQYIADYRNKYTTRSIADKGYADSAMAQLWQSADAAIVYSTGNVGIGHVPSSAYSLAVNGFVLGKKIYVSASGVKWPDYVFDSSYVLQPLKDVAAYTRQYKHLPGMPSADTVEKEGVDVVDMQAALLQQVEELTLRLMKQHDKLQAQDEKLSRLEHIAGK